MDGGGVIEIAMQAAAAARAEREAHGAARRPVPRYRGVTRRGDMYVAEIMDASGHRTVYLGAYATAQEAACAYAAAARSMNGNNATMPNSPEPPAPVPVPVAVGGGRRVAVLPLVGHARVRRAPVDGQQPATPQALAAPVYGQQPAPRQALAARRQALAGHARMRAPLHSQQPAPPQAFSVSRAIASATVQSVVEDNFTNQM